MWICQKLIGREFPSKGETISELQDKKLQNTAGFSLGVFAEDTNVLVKNS